MRFLYSRNWCSSEGRKLTEWWSLHFSIDQPTRTHWLVHSQHFKIWQKRRWLYSWLKSRGRIREWKSVMWKSPKTTAEKPNRKILARFLISCLSPLMSLLNGQFSLGVGKERSAKTCLLCQNGKLRLVGDKVNQSVVIPTLLNWWGSLQNATHGDYNKCRLALNYNYDC